MVPINHCTESDMYQRLASSYTHLSSRMLCASAKMQGMRLTGELLGCHGCSISKGFEVKAPNTTSYCRADRYLGLVIIDLSGLPSGKSADGVANGMLVKNCNSCMCCIGFQKAKDETSAIFFMILARHSGCLNRVQHVRTANGTEFNCAAFR